MKKLHRLTNLLLALKLLAQQAHLLSISHSDHLLAERIEDGLDDNIDTLKELALFCYDEDFIASCAETAQGVFNILHEIKTDITIEQTFSYILEIIQEIVKECTPTNFQALDTAIGDTARDIGRKGYLVKRRLK
mgnify:CR=1 FL=1